MSGLSTFIGEYQRSAELVLEKGDGLSPRVAALNLLVGIKGAKSIDTLGFAMRKMQDCGFLTGDTVVTVGKGDAAQERNVIAAFETIVAFFGGNLPAMPAYVPKGMDKAFVDGVNELYAEAAGHPKSQLQKVAASAHTITQR